MEKVSSKRILEKGIETFQKNVLVYCSCETIITFFNFSLLS